MTAILILVNDGKTFLEREGLLTWIRESWGDEKAAQMERDIDRAVRDATEKASAESWPCPE